MILPIYGKKKRVAVISATRFSIGY